MLRFHAILNYFLPSSWKRILRYLALSLTYLGHSAIFFEVNGLNIYVDPYLKDPVDFTRLAKGHLILLSHGHFDHGAQLAPDLFNAWGCQFIGPPQLVKWMTKKYKNVIPKEAFQSLSSGESTYYGDVKIHAVTAHHPINRLGKTLLALFARSAAPGKPVNGYYFDGYYHAGATIYTEQIASSLNGLPVHTACLPIGGKYAIANPKEALDIAEGINAKRIVPMHWQPLLDQIFFRYQPSDLLKEAKIRETVIEINPLAIGETLDKLPVNDDLKNSEISKV